MRKNSRSDLYLDILITETLSSQNINKFAQSSGIVNQISQYVRNNIDEKNISGSMVNIIAPGFISTVLGVIGFPITGIFLGLMLRVLHIDINEILNDIFNSLKPSLESGRKLSSQQIDSAVQSSIQKQNEPITEEQAKESIQLIRSKKASILLREAKLIKIAISEVEINKTAGIGSVVSRLTKEKTVKASLLSRLLGLVFKVVIASAGLMVAGDVVSKVLGLPSALDGSVQRGKPATQPATHVATQTKFKINPLYRDTSQNTGESDWIENIRNDKGSIENMLVSFAKQVYSGLDNLDSVIKSSSSFQSLANRIVFYNHTSSGDMMVFIPKQFTSKKQVVDQFIDDVAEKTP